MYPQHPQHPERAREGVDVARSTLLAIAIAAASLAGCTRSTAERGEPATLTLATLPGVTNGEAARGADAGALRAPGIASPATSAGANACPEGMVLVEGDYCPDVDQTCLAWMDPPEDRYHFYRCAKYKQPATCKSKARVHQRFCIDATERREQGSDLPRNHMSWTTSKALCEGDGARLCKTSEWTFACEGEEMRPYAYGWERDPSACNVDLTDLGKVGRLVDHRRPVGSLARCVSPFGVHDMAGNVDEWATLDGAPVATRAVMKGSWWLPGRHACRAHQAGHDAYYQGTESGTRCCKDAPTETRISSR